MVTSAIWPALDYSRVPYRLYHDAELYVREQHNIAHPEVAGVGDLRRKAEKAPDRPAKDPLLLALIELGIVIAAEFTLGSSRAPARPLRSPLPDPPDQRR